MRYSPIRVSLSLLLLWITGCTDKGEVSSPSGGPPSVHEAYNYNASPDSGKTGVRGWFTLIPGESTSVHGEWHFFATEDSVGFGPQIGDGTLAGSRRNGMIDINMNPSYADNNVLLSGTVTDSGYAGSWTWITFAGPTRHGPFVATRR